MSSSSPRIAPLDGLRAVSILLVLFSHAWLGHLIPGGLGVTAFFFISGFIITRLMIDEYDQKGKLGILPFYGRRFLRLMPALSVYVIVSAFVLSLAGKTIALRELFAVFLYLANYYEIYTGFGDAEFTSPLAITWSLAVEEHFYLIFPTMFVVLAANWRRGVIIVISLLLVMLCWRCWLVFGVGLDHLPHERLYKGTDTRADSILYGSLLSLMISKQGRIFSVLCERKVFLAGLFLLVLTLLIRSENFRETLRYSVQGVAFLLIFPFVVFGNGRLSRFLSSPFFQYTGRISYSLYLYHWLAYGITAYWLPAAPLLLKIAVMASLSFCMADLSYRWIEKPGLRFGRNLLNS